MEQHPISVRPRLSPRLKQPWVILFLALTSLLPGCDTIWNLTNRGALERDIVDLFRNQGLAITNLKCNMIGTSRSATCKFRASAEQVASLVRSLNLKEVETEDATKGNSVLSVPEANVGCMTCPPFAKRPRMRIYLSERRPRELRLKSGSAFEYLVLLQRLDTDEVCVQIAYSYG